MQVSEIDEEFELEVDGETAGGRLDAVLAKRFPAFSRSRIKDLILNGPDLTGVDLTRNQSPSREFDW